jgi:lysophospholipase L1-like esterase
MSEELNAAGGDPAAARRTMTPRPMRTWVAKCVLSLVVLVGLPLATEIGFRLREPEPSKLFNPLPAKRTGELRIFVYGESVVWGAPLPAVGFVEQLRYYLTAIYPDRYVNVVNYGEGNFGWMSEWLELAAETMNQSPDVVIIMTGGNEIIGPVLPTALRRIREASAAIRAITRFTKRITRRLMPPQQAEDPWPSQLVAYDRADLNWRVDRLRDGLRKILDLAEVRGIPVLLCTEAVNLRDWAPVHLKLARADANGGAAAYEREMSAIERLIAAGKQEEVRAKLDHARSIYHEDAMLLYLDGRIHYKMEQYGRAHDMFTQAKELDPIAWRMLSAFNDVIRESGHRQGVRLVDVERIFSERSTGGSPGFDLIADNCHPTPVGSAIIAEALVKEILALAPSGAVHQTCCNVDDFLKAKNFRGSPLEVEYLLFLGRYTMKVPWYRFSISRDYLNKVVGISPLNWEAWANLATLSLLEGNVQRGREELNEAKALKGSEIDPNDRKKTPYLHEALGAAGEKSFSRAERGEL